MGFSPSNHSIPLQPQPPQENPFQTGRKALLFYTLPRAIPVQSTSMVMAPKLHKSQQCNLQWLQLSQNVGLPVSQNRSCLFSLSSPFPHYIFTFHRLNTVSRYPHPATGGRVSGGKGPFMIVVLQSASPARQPVPACTALNTL